MMSIPKVQCRACVNTTPDHRCYIIPFKHALKSGRKRRCPLFFARFSKHARRLIRTAPGIPVFNNSALQIQSSPKKKGKEGIFKMIWNFLKSIFKS